MDISFYTNPVFESIYAEDGSGSKREVKVLKIPDEFFDSFTGTDIVLNISVEERKYFVTSERESIIPIEFMAPLEFVLFLNNKLDPQKTKSLKLAWGIQPYFNMALGKTALIYSIYCDPENQEDIWEEMTPEEMVNELKQLAKIIRSTIAIYNAHTRMRLIKVNPVTVSAK